MAEMQHSEGSAVRMYGIVFTIIAAVALIGLVYMVLVRSQADTTSQTGTVANAAPTVDTVITAIASGGADQSSITPIENNVRLVYLRGAATDNNGCNDIDTASNWNYRVYRTNVASGSACTADNNDCYIGNAGVDLTFTNCTGAGDLGLDYEGNIPVQFWADATDTGSAFAANDWTSWVKAVDESAGALGTLTDTWELNSLIALGVDGGVNYGTVALGADSAVQTITFTQTGNRSFDVNQSVDGDLICNGQGSQNITAGQVKRHLTNSAFAWTDGAAVSFSTTPTESELNMGRRSNDAAALTLPYYLRLRLPATGLRGTCSNIATFTAIAEEAA